MQLRETFLTVVPRETAGPRSSDRSDYQRDWALCKLLKLHAGPDDYLIVFDLHDDVLVFDSATDPTRIAFYQIKTKDPGKWTRAQLTACKQGKEGRLPSPLGKLYSNRVKFPDHTETLTFVSNARIKVDLEAGGTSESLSAFPFRQLAQSERLKIEDSIKSEDAACESSHLEEQLRFEVAELSMLDHVGHARGKLSELFEALYPDRKFTIGPWYRTLDSQIRRRNNCQDQPSSMASFGDLQHKKGISREGFSKMLTALGIDEDLEAVWLRVENALIGEGVVFTERLALKRRWHYVEAQRFNPEDLALTKLMERVAVALVDVQKTGAPLMLRQLLDAVLDLVRQHPTHAATVPDDDVKALTLMRLYETPELPAAHQGAAEEEA